MAPGKRPRTKTLERVQSAPKKIKQLQISFPFLSGTSPKGHSGPLRPVLPPSRKHGQIYHRPGLLDSPEAQIALLDWFERVSKDRDMPWRQTWIDPQSFTQTEDDVDLTEALKRRAYQVWVSEIMLQQTRVDTVRSYYQKWHAQWPRIQDLAQAAPSDVLSAWRGLGYYSRATRLHTAAKKIVSDPELDGMLPELPSDLESKVPGVGRYTAGAISSIVFGHAVPILDGNVVRVLSRQTGLYANMSGKPPMTLLWEAADVLVKQATKTVLTKKGTVLEEEPEVPKSEIPSFWNQALMELGSTVCKPQKPDCLSCPIKSTCLAHAEGEKIVEATGRKDPKKTVSLAVPSMQQAPTDIEDLEICDLCEPMEDEEESDLVKTEIGKNSMAKKGKLPPKEKLKQSTLSFRLAGPSMSAPQSKPKDSPPDPRDHEIIERHVMRFPRKVVKKVARKEECIVCAIKQPGEDGPSWLIEQRPEKGLLASLWQFPSLTIFNDEDVADASESEGTADEEDDYEPRKKGKSGPKMQPNGKGNTKGSVGSKKENSSRAPPDFAERRNLAVQFARSLLGKSSAHKTDRQSKTESARHIKEAGSVTHLFSHIRLIMHVHVFEVDDGASDTDGISEVPSGELKEAEFQQRKWATRDDIEAENIGTGMRKCWAMVLKEDCK